MTPRPSRSQRAARAPQTTRSAFNAATTRPRCKLRPGRPRLRKALTFTHHQQRFCSDRVRRVPPIIVIKHWWPNFKIAPSVSNNNPIEIINRFNCLVSEDERQKLIGGLHKSLDCLRRGQASAFQWNDIELAYCISQEIETKIDLKGVAGALDAFNIARLMIRQRAFQAGHWRSPTLYATEIQAVQRFIELHAQQLAQITPGEYKRVFQAALSKMPDTGKDYVQSIHDLGKSKPDPNVIYKAQPGTTLESACNAAIELAKNQQRSIAFQIDGIELHAAPTDSSETLLRRFHTIMASTSLAMGKAA